MRINRIAVNGAYMCDFGWLIDELNNLKEESKSLQRKIDYICLRLNEINDEEIVIYREVINKYFKITNSSIYIKQSEIFKTLKIVLNNNLNLKCRCEKLGWKDSSPSNRFYRNFWKYLSSLPGVHRVIKSKNDIRIYGIGVKNY